MDKNIRHTSDLFLPFAIFVERHIFAEQKEKVCIRNF